VNRQQWVEQCQIWRDKWPVMQPEWQANDRDGVLNLYAVLEAVSNHSFANHVIMGDAGSISYAGPVALRAKLGQRFVFSPAQADMGWAVPASIGVSLASRKPVLAITGDGSFMSNLQELAVIRQHNLDIKIIILNNGGYLSIKNTQQKYFQGRVHGTSTETGLWFPNFLKVAESFDMSYYRISTASDLATFSELFDEVGPAILDCCCLPEQEILPAQALKNGRQAGLHDMTPFLSDEELAREMKVKID